jgi:peptidoglycan glycosyltransferase
VLAGTVITALAGPLAAFTAGYLALAVPAADGVMPSPQVALLSFTDGSRLGELVPAASARIEVPIERVPAHVRAAVLAAEDRTFYRDPGFDVGGLARAAWQGLRGGPANAGGITQQYLQQTRPGAGDTVWNRLTELVLAVKVSQQRSKDEILGDYLNSAYFGRGSYGIQAAARAYFGKDVANLTASEGALLAALVRSPTHTDPARQPDRAVQRWNAVLDGMTDEGWLDRGARAAAQFPTTTPRPPTTDAVPTDSSGHIVAAVAAELAELGISERDLAGGGLQVTTTLDPRRQRQALQATRGTRDEPAGSPRSAMVAIDPGTGGVLAYYGGDNGRGPDYARAQRLAGSTFTPFVVLARLLGDPARGGRVEPDAVAAAARAAGVGIPLDDDRADRADDREISALDLASAYATFAADGVWRPPHLVASVSTADGRVLYQAAPRGEQRFAPQVARKVTATMLEVAERDGLALPGGRPVAARTGTVEADRADQPDNYWTAGFTPELATSVWTDAGGDTPTRARSAWREFMTEALSEPPTREPAPDPAIAGRDGIEPDPTHPAGPGTTPTTTPAPSADDPPATTTTARPRPTGTDRPPASSPAEKPTTSTPRSPRPTTDPPDPDAENPTVEPTAGTDEDSGDNPG